MQGILVVLIVLVTIKLITLLVYVKQKNGDVKKKLIIKKNMKSGFYMLQTKKRNWIFMFCCIKKRNWVFKIKNNCQQQTKNALQIIF